MNNTVSLPRLRSNSEFSKPIFSMERKRSVDRKKIESIKEDKLQNGEQQIRNAKKEKLVELKRAKSELFKKRNVQPESQQTKQKKYGLLQNGKLSKITENSILSKAQSSDRTKSTKFQNHNKQHAAALKKQLNEIISSTLILRKQIKAIQGGTLQVKEQIKNILQNTPQENSQVEKKIQEIKKKTQNFRYDQQVLKNMKQRMKKINIFYQKKAIDLKQTLQRQERKIKVLNQRSSIREESINKQKMLVKIVQQKQKTINRLNEIATLEYEKKIREVNAHKQLAEKKAALKMINENEYHFEVYKKQQAKLFEQLRANLFLQQLLESRWNKYSQIYGNAQKAQKLMQMHSLQKDNEQFDPRKIYYGSFDNKKQLQQKIKNKEMKLAQLMKKNTQLQKQWKNIQFNQIDEQQKIIDKKAIEIKTGKIQEKQVIEKHQREIFMEMRQKLERSKLRVAKMSRIKDWVIKLENQLQLKPIKQSKIEDRLVQVINWMKKQYKQQKDIKNKTL